jgi:hypothetical protein
MRFVSVLLLSLLVVVVGPMSVGAGNAMPGNLKESWDWLSPAFTPCEGVGVHGNARYYATVEYVNEPIINVKGVLHISVYGESASFDDEDTGLAVFVEKQKGDGPPKNRIILTRPTGAAIEEKPGPNQTKRLYWAATESSHFSIFPGDRVRISVTATKDNCKINSSTNLHELP